MKKVILQLAILGLLLTPLTALGASSGHIRLCTAKPKVGSASCHIHIKTDLKNNFLVNSLPQGFGPQDLRRAYNLSGSVVKKTTVAIVDAYDNPTIQNDLDTYSSMFNLPQLPPCTTDISQSLTPCFQKSNQTGGKKYPSINSGWATEIALDVEAVHALCENCSILLVEASSQTMKNLLAAEDFAATKAGVISNSWGGPEISSETSLDEHFKHNGVAITVSSGDSGYGVEYPAASPYVTAVGGTSLYLNSTGGYQDENAWSGSGSGCSLYEPKPSWQTDVKCSSRTVADVSAVADPQTGFAIYTQSAPKGKKGWFKAGGTSLASPIIAAVYALSGNISKQPSSLPYNLGKKSNLHDVVGGSNGLCSPLYLCTGKTKYDGPTGLGSPNGTGAF